MTRESQLSSIIKQAESAPQSTGLALLPLLARQNALARPLKSEGLCNLYAVEELWEAEKIASECDVISVMDIGELSYAIQQSKTSTLLVRFGDYTNLPVITKLMRYSSAPHTIFWHHEAHE